MATRTRFLLLALALLPVAEARADRHGMECFGGYTFSKQSLSGASVSCGVYVDFFVEDVAASDPVQTPYPPPPAPPPSGGSGGSWGQPDAERTPTLPPARRTFVVGDLSRLTGERDGRDLTRYLVLGGLRRYLFVREPGSTAPERRWHPFVHALAGMTFSSQQGPTRHGFAAAAGGGIDVRLVESTRLRGWGNLFLRGQCDVARLAEPGETVWRCAAGPSLRDEDY